MRGSVGAAAPAGPSARGANGLNAEVRHSSLGEAGANGLDVEGSRPGGRREGVVVERARRRSRAGAWRGLPPAGPGRLRASDLVLPVVAAAMVEAGSAQGGRRREAGLVGDVDDLDAAVNALTRGSVGRSDPEAEARGDGLEDGLGSLELGLRRHEGDEIGVAAEAEEQGSHLERAEDRVVDA